MAEEDDAAQEASRVLKFPASRTTTPSSSGGFTDLGVGAMGRALNMRDSQMTGHWCSRCHGIWFGYAFEVECPRCGNRHG
ncbi:MAG: hypothetical protein ACYC5H_13765 [Methylovirgula sp.]